MGRLAETIKEWVAEKEAAGIAQGLKQGLEQGRVQRLEEGLEEGLIQGKRGLLLQLVESKDGLQVREELTETLQQCTKPEALDRFADWILECDTAEELHQRMRSNSNRINSHIPGEKR